MSEAIEVPAAFRRLYRAHITPPDGQYERELTAFVEAGTREAAIRKIAGCLAILEYRKPEEVTERIYNLYSAAELIDENLSENLEERLMETGWSGGKPTHFVQHPLVLMSDPSPLLRIWARVSKASS